MQVTPAQSNMPAVVAPYPLGDTRGRANDFYVPQTVGADLEPEQSRRFCGLVLAVVGVDVVINQMHQAIKGRVALLVPRFNLLLVKLRVVLLRRGHNGVVIGIVGLDYDPSWRKAPTGPSGNLT